MKTTLSSATLALALLLSGCMTTQKLFTFTKNFAVGIYTATAQQLRLADQRGAAFFDSLSSTKKQEMKTAGTRYLAVQTSDPTPEQWKQIRRDMERPASMYQTGRSAPSKIHCVMIWDTQTRQVVGTDCYAVTTLPKQGEVAKFDTFTAQYVGVSP